MSAHQVVLFGATSFVGQILCRYLLDRHGATGSLRWAIAGRSRSKLEEVRATLGERARDLPVLVADAADEVALRTLCGQAQVIVSTVGPYALYGSPLVKACAETGTDYCDLTGEVQWVRRMLDAHEVAARRSGARIVHCCGFDSIPSDLGVHFLQRQARERFGEPCVRVKLRIKAMRGGASGGTAASILNIVSESLKDPQVLKVLSDPYALCPESSGQRVRQPGVAAAAYDSDAGAWIAPFVMAAINTRIVHRSNALSGLSYGADFQYDEAIMTGKGPRGAAIAAAVTAGVGGFMAAAAFPPTRWALKKTVIPQPGEGPSPQDQKKGFYDIRFFGRTASGRTLTAKVTGDRDPGYGSTAKILGEVAACLATETPKTERPGGFWTPATLFGDRLVARLSAHSGLTFDVLES